MPFLGTLAACPKRERKAKQPGGGRPGLSWPGAGSEGSAQDARCVNERFLLGEAFQAVSCVADRTRKVESMKESVTETVLIGMTTVLLVVMIAILAGG
jgi:hypothetical protein